MDKVSLKAGDLVQINPEHDKNFGASIMVVTDPESFGAQGYVLVPGKGRAYYRCAFENMELVGKAAWIAGDDVEETNKE